MRRHAANLDADRRAGRRIGLIDFQVVSGEKGQFFQVDVYVNVN